MCGDDTEHWADPCYAVVNSDGDYVGAHSGRKDLAEGLVDDLDEKNPDEAPHRVRKQSFNDLPDDREIRAGGGTSSSGTERKKIERARELLQEAHDELGYPDNSLLGPAIDQIDAHERRHWSRDAEPDRDEEGDA